MTPPSIRPASPADRDAFAAIQIACYPPPSQEDVDTIVCHVRVSPETCFVVEDELGPAGYLLAHPWPRLLAPPIDTIYDAIPPQSDSLYIHDLAILPRLRGRGLASHLVKALFDTPAARSLTHASLIAVQGTEPFWEKWGFLRTTNLPPSFHESVLRFYPDGQVIYMERKS